ncbi:MAG: MFS transporter [Holdemanella sp.]|nr:MFS transporter [Holdemanella sp.]
MKKKEIGFYIAFALMMVCLGCSDALRGVFAPIFQSHYQLNASMLSLIITISYAGNFVFMLIGSRLSDEFGIRKVFIASMLCWIAAMALYVVTDSYITLVIGVFFAMGGSTLLNMMLNIMSPILFLAPATIVNTLFFVQGIGTTFAQGIVGRFANSISYWKYINLGMIIMGILSLVLFITLSKNEKGLSKSNTTNEKEKVNYKDILSNPVFYMFILIFGFYFVAEHGIMNWMNIYCQTWLHMELSKASLMPTLFFGGIMIGRLVIAPFVTKLGIQKSLLYCLLMGTIIFTITMVIGGSTLYLLILAGLGFSIVYPTMTMCIQLYFPQNIVTTASGTILSVATLFDILFNAIFGMVIDKVGYGLGMMILPISAILCVLFYIFMMKRYKPIRKI